MQARIEELEEEEGPLTEGEYEEGLDDDYDDEDEEYDEEADLLDEDDLDGAVFEAPRTSFNSESVRRCAAARVLQEYFLRDCVRATVDSDCWSNGLGRSTACLLQERIRKRMPRKASSAA